MKVMRKAIDAGKNEGFYDSSHDEESDYNDNETVIIEVDFKLLMLELMYSDNIKPSDYINIKQTVNNNSTTVKGNDIDLMKPCFIINDAGDIKHLRDEYKNSVKVHRRDGNIVYEFIYDFMYGKINFSISFKSLMSILNFNK